MNNKKYEDTRIVTFQEDFYANKDYVFKKGKPYAMHRRVAESLVSRGIKLKAEKLDPGVIEQKHRADKAKAKAKAFEVMAA